LAEKVRGEIFYTKRAATVSIYYEEKIDHVDFGAIGSSCALLQQLRACSPIQ
jgi:hypothetical protein